MKYKNAQDILPDRLLKELQQYVSGENLYVPRRESRRQWGESSGARRYYQERNERIVHQFQQGKSLEALAAEFHLSVDSIRKLVYSQRDGGKEPAD